MKNGYSRSLGLLMKRKVDNVMNDEFLINLFPLVILLFIAANIVEKMRKRHIEKTEQKNTLEIQEQLLLLLEQQKKEETNPDETKKN